MDEGRTHDASGETSWYTQAVRRVAEEADRLHEAVTAAVGLLEQAARDHDAGVDLREVVSHLVEQDGLRVRRSTAAAFAAFEASLLAYRSEVVTVFVEELGMTYADVGRLIGVSRQMVARLHRGAGGSART